MGASYGVKLYNDMIVTGDLVRVDRVGEFFT